MRLIWRPQTQGVVALSAASVLGLVRDQVVGRRPPCQRCAYGPILSELAELAAEAPGYHVLLCRAWHWTTARQCSLCTELRAYAADRPAHLAGLAGGSVALLGPGALPATLAALLGELHLAAENTGVADTPGPVSARLWAAAAQLYQPPTTLGQALGVAAALFAEPPHPGRKPPPG